MSGIAISYWMLEFWVPDELESGNIQCGYYSYKGDLENFDLGLSTTINAAVTGLFLSFKVQACGNWHLIRIHTSGM